MGESSAIISEYDLSSQRKKTAETLIESQRNHLSALLVASIWFAIQQWPRAIQINTEEDVRQIGPLTKAAERQILMCSRCFMIGHNGLLETTSEAVARNY